MATLQRWFQDAYRLHKRGEFAAAEKLYRRFLGTQPNDSEALYLLGSLHVQRSEYAAAVPLLEKAVALNPGRVEAYNNLGVALKELGRTEEAAAIQRQALQISPDYVEAHNNLGIALHALGRSAEAEECYRTALRLRPDYVQAHNNLGIVLKDVRRLDEAAACFERALALHPAYVEGINNLGLVWQLRKQFDKALECHTRAAALQPTSSEALCNMGVVLNRLGRTEEARAWLMRALECDPLCLGAHTNIGLTHLDEGQPEAAMAAFGNALALKDNDVLAHWNRSLTRLLLGDFAQGWAEYESRFEADKEIKKMFASPIRREVPVWEGEPLAGKTLWVRAEQGFGDTFQFVRFLPALRAQGARIIFECQRGLKPLLSACAGIDTLIEEVGADEAPPAGCDAQVYLMSLPYRLGLTTEEFSSAPYLAADPEKTEFWQARLREIAQAGHLSPDNFKVGIVWAGSPTHGNDARRSSVLAHFAPLAAVPGVTLFSLQKGPAGAQAADPPEGMLLVDLGPAIEDFTDTAAIIANLDLVIAVDTSVVHLAGGLGAPVWTLLPHTSEWRWQMGRTDSPWYPSMRLFRQTRGEGWPAVMTRVTAALADTVREATTPDAVRQAEAALAAGDLATAKALLRDLTAGDRPHARALNALGVVLWQEGESVAALREFLRAVQAAPDDAAALLNAADALCAFSHWADAAALYGRYLQAHPADAEIRARRDRAAAGAAPQAKAA